MLTKDQLKEAVHQKGISKTDTALLCVAASGVPAFATEGVKKLAIQTGVKGAAATNWSSLLGSASQKVIKTPDGWELTIAGREHVAMVAAQQLANTPAAKEAKALREVLPKIVNLDAREFLTEAIACAELSLHRAAVVLSWVGAVALLHDYVIKNKLAEFNAEARRRDPKWKSATTTDDLGNVKEFTFLEILTGISVIGKNVKQELESCLKLRNSCGHPTSLKIGTNKVAAHLETLGLNVYSVFG